MILTGPGFMPPVLEALYDLTYKSVVLYATYIGYN